METVSLLGGISGLAVVIGGFIVAIFKICRRFENVEEAAKYRKEESAILIRSQLAIMEGLKQQGCNGPVSAMRDELQDYICKRGD